MSHALQFPTAWGSFARLHACHFQMVKHLKADTGYRGQPAQVMSGVSNVKKLHLCAEEHQNLSWKIMPEFSSKTGNLFFLSLSQNIQKPVFQALDPVTHQISNPHPDQRQAHVLQTNSAQRCQTSRPSSVLTQRCQTSRPISARTQSHQISRPSSVLTQMCQINKPSSILTQRRQTSRPSSVLTQHARPSSVLTQEVSDQQAKFRPDSEVSDQQTKFSADSEVSDQQIKFSTDSEASD